MAETRPTASQREIVLRRAHGCCEYCRSHLLFSSAPFAIEHIVPQARGGATEVSNLALSCHGCNGAKYTHTEAPDPMSGAIVPLYHPRRDRWEDHFKWTDDFELMIGVTATGRATIETLNLNRDGVVNQRRLLRAVGLHPPPPSLAERDGTDGR